MRDGKKRLVLGFSGGERIRCWSMATGGGCGAVAGVNTVLQGSVVGIFGGLRLRDCTQRLELKVVVCTQRLELKLVVCGRLQLETAVALLQNTTLYCKVVLGLGVGE
jgi:hypothetical protein